MTNRFEVMPFHQHQILTVRQPEGIFVVMKPVVEALGLTWQGQHWRITQHPVISKGINTMLIPSAGGMQEMLCLHLERFHGWLVTLDPRQVKDEDRRAAILLYQEEAFRTIFEHFHGRMGKRLNLQSVSSRVSLQNQTLRLAQKLQVTRNRVERRMMHQMLEGMCAELGIDTPALEELGHDAPQPPDILRTFWDGIETLKARGVDFNHSRVSNLLALNLKEIRQHFKDAGIRVEIDAPMRKALKQSDAPRFIADKAVNSRIIGGAKSCWVFQIEP
ncbi:phage antirepressor N-terminal domain-containing protein [Pedomonas sp. V897]|uniref:phage antirepressor N-terminal domain-containing protein n=1 Tax=Pedomonas sp. V897 TaxID=3446482 RepID=UPI003EE267CA